MKCKQTETNRKRWNERENELMRKLWFSFWFLDWICRFIWLIYFHNNGKCNIFLHWAWFCSGLFLLVVYKSIVLMVQVIRVAQSNRYTCTIQYIVVLSRFIVFSQRRIHYFKLILIFTAFTFAFIIFYKKKFFFCSHRIIIASSQRSIQKHYTNGKTHYGCYARRVQS